jgi:hypothetical protein
MHRSAPEILVVEDSVNGTENSIVGKRTEALEALQGPLAPQADPLVPRPIVPRPKTSDLIGIGVL